MNAIADKRELVRRLEDYATNGERVTVWPVEAQYIASLIWADINGKVQK